MKALHTLTGLSVTGTALGQAMLCVSRLTPLRKSDGGLRPIAVGDMIYRLVTKAIIRDFNRRDAVPVKVSGVTRVCFGAGVGLQRDGVVVGGSRIANCCNRHSRKLRVWRYEGQ